MAHVHLPSTLTALFGDLPRRVEVDAGTVADAITRLDERWPGLRDRLCENGSVHALRKHIHVYVDRERAELDTVLAVGSRVDVIAAISGG
jgi:molybdopterin converting factor small subunit